MIQWNDSDEHKAIFLYEYIVNGAVTEPMGETSRSVRLEDALLERGIVLDRSLNTIWRSISKEFNLNDRDKKYQRSGPKGKDCGRCYGGQYNGTPFGMDEIYEYMSLHRQGICSCLADYLDNQYTPQQQTYTPPQQTYYAPPQQAYIPQQDDCYDNSDKRSYNAPAFSGIIAKLCGVAVLVAAAILLYNLVLKPSAGVVSDFLGSKDSAGNADAGNKPAFTTSYYSTPEWDKDYGNTAFGVIENDDGTAHLGIVVEFKAEESEMEGVEEYRMCIGSDTGANVLTPGRTMSGDIDLPVGKKFNVWVASGDAKSEVYSIEIGPKGGTACFDCTVGKNGKPVLTSTSVLGKYLWVTEAE